MTVTPINAQQQDVIETLRRALVQAEAGQLVAMALLTASREVADDGHVWESFVGGVDVERHRIGMLGALHMVAFDVAKAANDEAEDA